MNQYELLRKIQDNGYNIVSCGSCGDVFIQDTTITGELECPFCGLHADPCYFPDLFYEGWDK